MCMVDRIKAVAYLDERPTGAEPMRARAREGDDESTWMLEQWEAGRLLLACIVLTADARGSDGEAVSVQRVIDGVWLEHGDLPSVESQVADVAPAELRELTAELRKQGVEVRADELDTSFIHVELDEGLRLALGPAGERTAG